ncbi:MAG: HAMP domain-containing sensor histidine kinase [Saprospiraceae bacterium]
MKNRFFSLQILTTLVLAYMVLAFAWWAVQLWRENDRLFAVSTELLETQHGGPRRGVNLTELMHTAEYQALEQRRQKHKRMILAEGVFFTLCLGFGLYVINRSAKREVALARQRRNFMLSITHELRSPIAAIRLALETLNRRELQREQIEKLCGNGLRDAARLQNLVEDLLLAARLEDNWHPSPEPLDVRNIAQDCAANLLVRFPAANIELDIPPDFPPVRADRAGFTAVVQNLLENAVKYSPEGAFVRLSAENVDGLFHLRVADSGIGIPDIEKAAIFEKFYRVGNEETRRAAGTGLGLYIVKQVLQAHGGRISVTDNAGGGTVFVVDM